MSFVSAAEFVRNFARLRDESRTEPIFITHHGRETHVLCDVETWRELAQGAAAGEATDPAFNEGMAFGLADWINEGIIACDQDLSIVFANRIMHGLVRAVPGSLVGKPLLTALPQFAGGLMEVQARHTLQSGEANMADIPSPFAERSWLRFQSFPLYNRLVLSLRDVTLDVERHFKANVKEAIMEAMDQHGAISYVRVSLRGTIDHVETPFCELLELPEARLGGVLVSDLVAAPDKPRFREGLEAVLRGLGPRRLSVRLLSNRGQLISVRLSIVQLDGLHGVEGAIILLTEDAAVLA